MLLDPPPAAAKHHLKKGWYVATFLVALLLVATFFLQKIVLTRTVEVVLPWLARSVDCHVHWNHLQVGLFSSIIVEGIQIRAYPERGETNLTASRVVLEFAHLGDWFKGRKRFFCQLKVEELKGTIDFRVVFPSYKKSLFGRFLTAKHQKPSTLPINEVHRQLMVIPSALKIQAPDLTLLFDGVTYRLHDFFAQLSEDIVGKIRYSFMQVEMPNFFKKNLSASSASATWKLGELGLSQWSLLPNCTMEQVNINFLNPEGWGVHFDMAAFGGTVKGSFTMKGKEIRPYYWNAAFMVQQVEIGPLAKTLEIEAPISGILKEAKLTFRGRLSDLLNAEASIHINAEEFRWNDLGWQTLEFGADLINRRIAIPELTLCQKENSLHVRGSAAIPNNLRDFPKMPFEVSILGDIQDLSALAGLLGSRFQQLQGRMTLDGSLWSSKEGPNGYFKLEGSSIQFQESQFATARMNAIFRNGHVQIASCELWNGEDFLLGQGTIDLTASSSYQYSGTISLRMQEIKSYRSLVENWQKNFYSGALEFTWQGDGTSHKHSGAFALQMENFVSLWTPNGVSGHFEGTFSPGFVSCNRFELFRNALRLKTDMSFSSSGIKINNFQVAKEEKEILAGSGFLPLDLFALAAGVPWEKALQSEEPVFVDLNSKKLELEDLYNLAGQHSSLSGRLTQGHLSLTGAVSTLQGNGQFSFDRLKGIWNGKEIPFSKMQMKMEVTQSNASFIGTLGSQKNGETRKNMTISLTSFLHENLSKITFPRGEEYLTTDGR